MRNHQSEEVSRLIRQHEAIEAQREAEARQVAHVLIQGYMGPDHKVINMQSFYGALVQALRAARMQGPRRLLR
jgi:hypothetical protein